MWVERYRDPGEFKIEAPFSSGLKDFLPIGTLISHADTLEVMIVENHHIQEAIDEDPKLTITGRSFESYLEQRVLGYNEARTSTTVAEISYASGRSWDHAKKMVNDAIFTTANDPQDRLPGVEADVWAEGDLLNTQPAVVRTFQRGPVHPELVKLLAIDDFGIKTIRANYFEGTATANTQWIMHNGTDKSASVMFTWVGGDISQGEYLWSIKEQKNAALVVGRYVHTYVLRTQQEYDRRWMYVDGTYLDDFFSAAPTGATLTAVQNKMYQLGTDALRAQNDINIARADISPGNRFKYRRDYNIGDLVTVNANYQEIGKMRVVEYVETEDENGEGGYPTLAIPGVDE
jgi:hypothetical protein